MSRLIDKLNPITGTINAIRGGVNEVKSLFGNSDKEARKADQRQVDQQGKLNEVNAKTAKELADYEQQLKMKMWQDTNYTALLREADKAGVSKAHALGSGGMGVGQGASVGNVGGGSASGGAENQMAKINSRLMESQIANMDAQTVKTKAEADKIAGADTANVQADTTLKAVQAEFDKVRNEIQGKTLEDQINFIRDEAMKMMHDKFIAGTNQSITEATQVEQQNIIKNQASMQMIEMAAKEQGIILDQAKVEEIAQGIAQKWEQIGIGKEANAVSERNNEAMVEAMLISAGINAVGGLTQGLMKLRGMGGKAKTGTTTKGGKPRENPFMSQQDVNNMKRGWKGYNPQTGKK